MKKLPGQPNIKVYFDKKSIEIPIIIISNETEKVFYTEIFNRFFNLERYLIHRTLFLEDPYIAVDEFGQKFIRLKPLSLLIQLAKLNLLDLKQLLK